MRQNGKPTVIAKKEVDFMDVATNQAFSIVTSMIPFLNHDDAHRALMGSNMQKQATPCLIPEAPFVATGVESRAAEDTRRVVSHRKTARSRKWTRKINDIQITKGKEHDYRLTSFERTNGFTVFHQRPVVSLGR